MDSPRRRVAAAPRLRRGYIRGDEHRRYGLGQCLLAYAAATRAGCAAARPFLDETWETLEKHLFVPADGLYAEEADERWTKDPYRSESGNLHMTEALIACYEATSDEKYLDRAVLVADRVCNRAAGQTQGLVWEHFKEDWSANLEFDNDDEALKIFRPWGFQPGHQVEWARFLLTLARHAEAAGAPRWWLVPKAKFLFDVAVEHARDGRAGTEERMFLVCATLSRRHRGCRAVLPWIRGADAVPKTSSTFRGRSVPELRWDAEHGGLCYSIDLDASVCNHDKIFWVQCEAIGTAAILGSLTGEDKYWATSARPRLFSLVAAAPRVVP